MDLLYYIFNHVLISLNQLARKLLEILKTILLVSRNYNCFIPINGIATNHCFLTRDTEVLLKNQYRKIYLHVL